MDVFGGQAVISGRLMPLMLLLSAQYLITLGPNRTNVALTCRHYRQADIVIRNSHLASY